MSYSNKDGFEVKTSMAHRQRGYCCQSSCLHCPYGFTIKKLGIQFEALSAEKLQLANELSHNKIELNLNTLEDFEFFYIKGHLAGIMRKDKLFVKPI